MTQFAAPGGYAQWTSWLAAFARGEDLPTAHLPPVDARMGPPMQERLLAHIASAFHERQRQWNLALTRDLDACDWSTPSVATALAAARARLAPLVQLGHNPLLPNQLRTAVIDALTQTVRSVQRSLEDSANENPLASARLLAVVRDSSLLAALAQPPTAAPKGGHPPAPGRRVIL